MKEVYLFCNLTKQAHHQAMERLKRQIENEEIYIRLMEQTREIHPGMGLRTMYDLLQPEGIGRDAFIALGLQQGFRLKAIEKYTRTTQSIKSHRYRNLLKERRFTDINQLWSSDITFIFCLDRFYYLVVIMDVYSRRIVGYSLSTNMRAENNFNALKMALQTRGINHYKQQLIHHSDKGSQYASDLYTQTLEAYGIQISMCEEVFENTHIERVHQTIKNQYLERFQIKDEKDLKRKVDWVIEVYNTKRPHKSLYKMTPVGYEQYLRTIPKEERVKMEIYTIQKDNDYKDPNQLKLVFL
jgi:transposase InsO family protein